MNSSQIQSALDAFRKGGFVIVTDDEKRENEGDLFLLASAATKEKLAFMIRYTSGVICVAMTEARSRELHLPLMVKNNQDTKRTAFTVTVDAKAGITTGISAEERANTIRTLADSKATAEDFVRPGHIFPLIAHENGLLGRQGHTEAVVEMCRMVGDVEVGVISELVNEDGSMMRGSALQQFSVQHQIPVVTIASLVQLLRDESKDNPRTSDRKASPLHWADLPRRNVISDQNQNWQITTFSGRGGVDHAVLRFGALPKNERALLRIHSECLTGDVLGSLRCDCGSQLERAMSLIESHGSGLVIYLRDQEGRGIGLSEKIRAYELQDQGLDTVEANLALGHDVDERDFADAVEILHQLGLLQVTLLTNNPQKLQTLLEAGISATAEDLHGDLNEFNQKYIQTKRERLGHK
ncbi:MAG: 3,4-dihydroxy-2-butanone-4-phosphate synthase [Candidatus Nanopelagicaceae bacterium]|jgi:3,4-dihydroxy 2-butanone 4-phosphate synthase/GTP cyclohydrolase II|nr:3,4-dihydroxy-2-butanone-4-phosphate synthase [Candidatus Nanopelagicaceae bacterium]